ncbi:large conductance mechanosensitive channel protein MscL [Xanthobacter sp. V4C-4]|uniref:large conductance mechanosensitive channel protein MscL n=1 Tax=Xanthobacter cornucopiae TaxID=3119924 RepID=UPI00372CCDA6
MLKEFQEFAVKGNVVDLAVGVIIGAAFGNIVTSLVGDIFLPVIGAVTGGLDFSNYFIPLAKSVTAENLVDAKKQGAVLAYGAFITIAINFLIVAGVLFLLVRAINTLRRNAEKNAAKAPAAPPRSEVLLEEIRDLLAKDVAAKAAAEGRTPGA